MLPEFADHARDARFLGGPVDYVNFDGLMASGGQLVERAFGADPFGFGEDAATKAEAERGE